MNTATFLSWVLAVAPEPSTPTEISADFAAIERTDTTIQITTSNATGDVTAELFVWADSDGILRLFAAWPDGLYLSVATDIDGATVDTENAAEVADRMDVMRKTVDQKGWGACALHVVDTAISCSFAHLWCPVAGAIMACECLPKIVDEWEGHHCPGFG